MQSFRSPLIQGIIQKLVHCTSKVTLFNKVELVLRLPLLCLSVFGVQLFIRTSILIEGEQTLVNLWHLLN